MQASGGQRHDEGHQQQQQPQHTSTTSQSMSRNGSSGAPAASAASPASSTASEHRSQSDGGAAPRLKIRLGGSTLGGGHHAGNRATSTSSEGTNGHTTPRAASPAAVVAVASPRMNGHSEDQHHYSNEHAVKQNGSSSEKGNDIHTVKKEDGYGAIPSPLPMGKTGSNAAEEDVKSQQQELKSVSPMQEGQQQEEQQSLSYKDLSNSLPKERTEAEIMHDMAELPNIARQSLVPLYELVRRLVARSYTDLQSIVEVCVSCSHELSLSSVVCLKFCQKRQCCTVP